MSTKHTPGPWSVDPDAPEYVTGYQIASTVQGDHMEPVSEANARLIAAAPELLAVLEQVAQYLELDRKENVNSYAQRARLDVLEVIAKAQG